MKWIVMRWDEMNRMEWNESTNKMKCNEIEWMWWMKLNEMSIKNVKEVVIKIRA